MKNNKWHTGHSANISLVSTTSTNMLKHVKLLLAVPFVRRRQRMLNSLRQWQTEWKYCTYTHERESKEERVSTQTNTHITINAEYGRIMLFTLMLKYEMLWILYVVAIFRILFAVFPPASPTICRYRLSTLSHFFPVHFLLLFTVHANWMFSLTQSLYFFLVLWIRSMKSSIFWRH